MKRSDDQGAWLPEDFYPLEAFEPEAYDSGQRKRYLRCEHERLQSLLKHKKAPQSAPWQTGGCRLQTVGKCGDTTATPTVHGAGQKSGLTMASQYRENLHC